MKAAQLTHRYVARIEFEAVTPMFIGAGKAGLLVDALIRTDWNGLPMIPGTSLAGILRHSISMASARETAYWKDLFGYQEKSEGVGSRLRVSDGLFVLHQNKVLEEISDDMPSDLENLVSNLPVRRHVRISHKGAAEKNGLFDNQVLPKGARFRCEISIAGNEDDQSSWESLLKQLQSPQFRIGQGTRNGYGKLSVYRMATKTYDLRVAQDKDAYLNLSPSLNSESAWKKMVDDPKDGEHSVAYQLTLKPDSFFIFSAGRGDEKSDNVPVSEWTFKYDEQTGSLLKSTKESTLIPATSIKGAIAHRVCYHHNRLTERFVDSAENPALRKDECPAVAWLFGSASNEKGKENAGHAGRVIIDDMLRDDLVNDTIFNHVTIDRFTGGAKRGFLFSERVSNTKQKSDTFSIRVQLLMNDLEGFKESYLQALECALADICKGLLPLGGMTTKGHGMFTGTLSKNNSTIAL